MKYLLIEYNNNFTLKYRLRDNAFVSRWVKQVQLAQEQYAIDDPTRFYGFGPIKQQQETAVTLINQCVDDINEYNSIIDRKLTTVNDQDTLNYLHNIFERYHGMLQTQTHDFWNEAPEKVQQALANLNVLVHHCEGISRGSTPRHVVTYYGLPKTETLNKQDYELFERSSQIGTVYLNYVEIGKTLEDLVLNRDNYIGDDAFRPWKYFSADFNVKFWQDDPLLLKELDAKIKQYYFDNQKFFESLGYHWGDPSLDKSGIYGGLPLADLENNPDNLLTLLENNQKVTSVTFE